MKRRQDAKQQAQGAAFIVKIISVRAQTSFRGFTLLELMVASGILVLSLVAFLACFNNLLNGAKYNQGISLASSACRTKLEEIMAHDYSSIAVDYAPGGTPGNTFRFTPVGTTGIIGEGTIVITPVSGYSVSNGMHWVQQTASAWPVRAGHVSVVFDGKMWVMGGYDQNSVCKNDVWSSPDGKTWTPVTAHANWSPRVSHGAIVYNGKMWVMGGLNGGTLYNDLWSSTNGVQWDCIFSNSLQCSPRFDFSVLVYNDYMWLIAGNYGTGLENDIYNYKTGSDWSMVTWNPPYSRRFDHTSVVYDNKMWVMGGSDGSAENDVWYSTSTDGKNWAQATAHAGWPVRDEHTSVVYDNKVWILGGGGGGGIKNDVWYSTSTDCKNWAQATAHAEWPARCGATSLVYDNKMWVLGGQGAATYSDVWYSTGSDSVLEVVITVCWKHPNGRVFGEDTDLNGVLDPGEDKPPLNGQIDSPVQLRVLLSEKNLPNLRRTFLGRP